MTTKWHPQGGWMPVYSTEEMITSLMEFRVYQKPDRGWYWKLDAHEWEVGPFETKADAEADAIDWLGDVEWD